MQKLCSKKGFKNIESHQTWSSKGSQQPLTNFSKIYDEPWYDKSYFVGSRCPCRGCQRILTNQENSLLFIYIYTNVEGKNIIPQTGLWLWGFWRLKGLVRDRHTWTAPRSRTKDDSRRRFVNIDVFGPPYYRSAEVSRPRALQPQQHVRARCL